MENKGHSVSLKPCPFCGRVRGLTEIYDNYDLDVLVGISCNCSNVYFFKHSGVGKNDQEVVKAWNIRKHGKGP